MSTPAAGIKQTDSGLMQSTERSAELAASVGIAEKQHEIQAAAILAKKFPRNEDQVFAMLMKAASRTSFADKAAYCFPRGDKKVSGPSVNLAREGARVWGNLRYGLSIVREDDESMLIRGWAWDLETNMMVTAEDNFKKLVFRKQGGWVKPDERDQRELVNRRGAISVRNCILQLLPKDLIDEALDRCKLTLREGVKKDPDGARKKLILDFGIINITPEMLEKKLGHPLAQANPDELTELRTIYQSIADGNSTWQEYLDGETRSETGATAEQRKQTLTDLQEKMKTANGGSASGQNADPAASQPAAPSSPSKTSDQPTDAVQEPLLAMPSSPANASVPAQPTAGPQPDWPAERVMEHFRSRIKTEPSISLITTAFNQAAADERLNRSQVEGLRLEMKSRLEAMGNKSRR